jgi:alpha-tubulin suppressor-like RCC1 family protein
LLLPACGDSADPPSAPIELGTANVALTTVPTGVLCIQVKVTIGTQTPIVKSVDVADGGPSVMLPLGQLPAGTATFVGSAFTISCGSVTSSTTAAWISDAATATLQPGVVTDVELTFRKNNPVTATANFLDNVAEIAVGTFATYARMADGTVKQWGNSGVGNTLALSETPQPVPSLTGALQIAAGSNFACARKNDNTVVCWGFNQAGQLGPSVPIGSLQATPVTIPVPGFGVSDIAAGSRHVCAIVEGSPRCWGGNDVGQLGDGTTVNRPTPITLGFTASRIFAGFTHTCFVDGSGNLRCWGANSFGQLGDGTTTNRLTPTFISGALETIDMGLGINHSCAVRADLSVRCWGFNGQGQLGNGSTVQSLTPVVVSSLSDATQIGAGFSHTCARRATGGVVCWGAGVEGELGDGTGDPKTTPAAVPGLTGIIAVRAHLGSHTCAELANRTVKCWGSNESGQIGDGTIIQRPTPTDVRLR